MRLFPKADFVISHCPQSLIYTAAMQRIIAATGANVTALAHPTKDGKGGVRGSGALQAMVERRRNTEAAMIVGTGLCGGKASVVAEMKEGDQYNTRIKCGG